ncbi:SDR family NAD(P)-dependent oxidoreductase [Kitasatospora sp. NBC_01266]|uniref:SDR family NAD(P)-dependent oxidoreductase n=1 Tax=Kitasatospora sp. NBC_01266 TaxID=2903572 RepID=UPI002E32BAC8|nr:SDR family NAD(P)-dependent oxidoreductase [Kitasatospora sp. NBC_01266]
MTDRQNTDRARRWLITGANSGLGAAFARAALTAGDIVIAAVRRPESIDALAAEFPGRITPVRLDVTDAEQCAQAVKSTDRSARPDRRTGQQRGVRTRRLHRGDQRGRAARRDGGDVLRCAAAHPPGAAAPASPTQRDDRAGHQLRLALGEDAVTAIRGKLAAVGADLDATGELSLSTAMSS